MTTLRLAALPLLLSLVVIGACTDDQLDLGTTEQGITFSVQRYFDCSTDDCTQVVLGSASSLTCALAGVTGRIDGWSGVGGDVNVFIDTSNNWEMTAGPAVQQVMTTCISAVQNRITGHADPAHPDVDLGLATAHRRCFLNGETFYLYGALTGLSYSDTVHVYQSRGHWYVGAHMAASGGSPAAYAVCVDVPSFVGTFTFSHDASGSATQNLVPSHNTNNACALSSLNGNFGVPQSGGAPYPGLRIYQLPDWAWTVNEHVGGEATCVSGTP